MAQYDGSIRISTEITTKDAEKELKSLESSISKTADKIAYLRSKMDALKDVKLPTQEYKEIQTQIEATEKRITALQARQEKFLATGGKESSSSYKKMQYDLEELQNSLPFLKGELQDLIDSGKAFTLGSDTDKYAEMAAQMEQLNQQIESDTQRQTELQSALASEEQRLADIKAKSMISDQQIIDLLERRKQLTSEIADMEKAGLGYGYQEYDTAQQELSAVNKQIKEYKDNLSKVPERFSMMHKSAQKAFSALCGGISKSNGLFPLLNNSADRAFQTVSKGAKQGAGLLSTFAGRLKGLAASAFIFNLMSKGFSSMVSSMKTGFTNLMEYSGSFADSIQSVKNSLSTLGNQIAAAFAPVVQAVIPWLNQLISVLATAMSYVAQFIAALTGKGSYIRAKKVQDAYNASLGGTAKKEKDVADNADDMSDSLDDTKKSADKARSALAAFDDLDVLEKQDEDTSNTALDKIKDVKDAMDDLGSGAGGGTGDWFEEVPIESSILDAVENLKNILAQIFAPLKEVWDRESKFVIDSWKYALGETWQLIKDIGRDFLTVWNQESTIQMFADMLHIVGDIGLVIGNLTHNLDEAWNKNQIGLQILENIRDIFAVIISNIREAADYTVLWSKNLDFYPLLEAFEGLTASLIPLMDNLSSALVFLYEHALLPIAKWAIESALPASIDVVSAAIDVLNAVLEALQPLGLWFWENFLQPLGAWAGDAIITALETISNLLTGFANWIVENSEAVQNFVIIMGSFAAAFKIVTTVVSAWSAISAIASAATTALGAAIAFLTSPVGIIVAAIGALIAAGVLLYKHWDEVKAAAENLKENIVNIVKKIGEWLTNFFSQLSSSISSKLQSIQKFFSDIWTAIYKSTTEIWTKVQEWFTQTLSNIQKLFTDIWTDIQNWFTGFWNRFTNSLREVWSNIVLFFGQKFNEIKQLFNNYMSFVSDIISNGWTNAWNKATEVFNSFKSKIESIVSGIKDVLGSFVSWVSDIVSKITSTIGKIVDSVSSANSSVDQLSERDISARSSYMLVNTYAYNLDDIPHLASGSVIRGGNPFMVMLGDQPHGQTNIEAPLSTIEQAVDNVMSRRGYSGGVLNPTIALNVNGQEFARLTLNDILREAARQGYDVSVLGVT